MKMQINRAFTVVSFLVAVTCTASVRAQSVRQFTFDIPFTSTVGENNLAPGRYSLQIESHSAITVLRLDSADGRTRMFMPHTTPVNSKGYSEKARLIFHRYGSQYFLAQVWGEGRGEGQEFPKSRAERELAGNRRTAKNLTAPSLISLVAQR